MDLILNLNSVGNEGGDRLKIVPACDQYASMSMVNHYDLCFDGSNDNNNPCCGAFSTSNSALTTSTMDVTDHNLEEEEETIGATATPSSWANTLEEMQTDVGRAQEQQQPASISPVCSVGNNLDCNTTLLEYRDIKNGPMTFKSNTEHDLLMHIQNGLYDDIKKLNEIDSSNAVLRSIDLYCLGKQWMYHIGQDKGLILTNFLQECIDEFIIKNNNNKISSKTPFVVVELGTYCGYSAILLAKAIREYAPDLNFHVYSTEINYDMLSIASSLIHMCKLEKYITLVHINNANNLSKTLSNTYGLDKIDYLFLDHGKDCYLSDLISLQKNNLIRKGSYVVADNVLYYSNLERYRRYVRDLSKQNIVNTSMVEMKLEYSNDQDGVELTKYLQDPPKN